METETKFDHSSSGTTYTTTKYPQSCTMSQSVVIRRLPTAGLQFFLSA